MTDSSYANRRALATFIFMLFISTMQQKHQIQRINSEMIEHKSLEELAANESKEKCTNEQQDFSNAMFFGGILAEYINKSNRANTTKLNSKQSIVKQSKNSCSRVDEMHGTTISQQEQSISSSSNSEDPSLGSTTTSFVEQDVLTAAPAELPAETTKQSSQQQQRIVVEEAQHPHQKRNYASKECGAKVLYANEEAENRGAILNDPERDDYMRNPCERAQNKFLIIELCETIQPTSLDIANLELFSSNPKEFRLSGSERYPTQEWALIGEYEAPDNREIHSFEVEPEHAAYAKFIKLELLSHHGNEHFCTLSTFRLYGTSMVDEYEAEASSLSEEQEKQRIASAKRAEKTRLEFLDRVLRRQTAAFCPLPSSAPLTCRRKSEASQNGQPQKQQQPKIGEQQRQESTETKNNNGNGATNGVKQLLIQKSIVANKVVDKANLRPLPGTSTNNKESVFMKLKSMAEKMQKLETKISALERENAVKQSSDPSMATMMQMLRDFGDKFGKIEKEMADLKEENRELKNENNKLREDIAELRHDLVEKGQELDEKCSFCMYN